MPCEVRSSDMGSAPSDLHHRVETDAPPTPRAPVLFPALVEGGRNRRGDRCRHRRRKKGPAIAALLAAPGSRRSRRSARSSTAMRRSRLGARRALSRSPRPKEHAARWVMMMMIQSGAAPTPKRLLEQHISTEVSSQLRFLIRKWMLGGTWCARCAVPGVVACHQPPPAMVRILVHCCGRLFRPLPQFGRQR